MDGGGRAFSRGKEASVLAFLGRRGRLFDFSKERRMEKETFSMERDFDWFDFSKR